MGSGVGSPRLFAPSVCVLGRIASMNNIRQCLCLRVAAGSMVGDYFILGRGMGNYAELRALKQAFMDDQIDEHVYASRRRAQEAREAAAALPSRTLDIDAALRLLDDMRAIAAVASPDQ